MLKDDKQLKELQALREHFQLTEELMFDRLEQSDGNFVSEKMVIQLNGKEFTFNMDADIWSSFDLFIQRATEDEKDHLGR